MSLKQQTVSGLIWSFVDTFAGQGITFVIGIILARLLSPREFGLIGMIVVFIAVSESFINSGFSNALIRKKDCTQTDYSTVFYYNLAAGISFFLILYFSASAISRFFKEPELESIIQVLGIILIIDSLTLIQRTILTKRIDFKLQARISLISALASGAIAITMAYMGYGVWSLVAQRLSGQAINSLLLWRWNRWVPSLEFNRATFSELFGFGSKILLSGLIETIYQNVYYLVIGKFFSAYHLGFYTKADEIRKIPSKNLNAIIARVSYPVLASIRHNVPRLKANYVILIRCTMFITFFLMLIMASMSETLIIVLFGEKWRPSIMYLQLLCLAGATYPLNALNLNMLQIQGRSDLLLKLEILKKCLALPIILVGIMYGIKMMILAMILHMLIAYIFNSHYSGRLIGYSIGDQLKDIAPSFLLSLSIAAVVFLLNFVLPLNYYSLFFAQSFAAVLSLFLLSEILQMRDYLYIKSIIRNHSFFSNNFP